MGSDYLQYVPCLRWKQGEYQAVSRLSAQTRRNITPLIEVPAIGYDFESRTQAKTLDNHLAPFAKRVQEKWGRQCCFVDLHLINSTERMAEGLHPVRFIFDTLRQRHCSVVPVTGIDRDEAYQQQVKAMLSTSESRVCIRLSLEQAARKSIGRHLNSLLLLLEVKAENCDLILDLGAPANFIPLDGFCRLVHAVVKDLPLLSQWRTFTFLGTSFPESMGKVNTGEEVVPRYEWQLYKLLITACHGEGLRMPTFGDYAVSHPSVTQLDMRRIRPAAKIRYTTEDGWYVVKGRNVREDRFGKFEQYRGLSRKIISSEYYCGPSFSWGDDYILKCAQGAGGPGNLTMWVEVDVNHHLEKVARDIASFSGSSNTL